MRFQWLCMACSGFLSVTYERSNIVIICVSIRSFILIFALFPTFPHTRGGREKKERRRKKQSDDDAVFDRFARNRNTSATHDRSLLSRNPSYDVPPVGSPIEAVYIRKAFKLLIAYPASYFFFYCVVSIASHVLELLFLTSYDDRVKRSKYWYII